MVVEEVSIYNILLGEVVTENHARLEISPSLILPMADVRKLAVGRHRVDSLFGRPCHSVIRGIGTVDADSIITGWCALTFVRKADFNRVHVQHFRAHGFDSSLEAANTETLVRARFAGAGYGAHTGGGRDIVRPCTVRETFDFIRTREEGVKAVDGVVLVGSVDAGKLCRAPNLE